MRARLEALLRVVGVRHHAPSCARLVRHVIRSARPSHVLIEGPSEMNGRMNEMALGHEPPVAVFTHYQDGSRRHASWSPFCSYSPEWVALEEARAVGAEARFCDLPAWHVAFEGRLNRYADLEGERERVRYSRMMEALCERTRSDDTDTLWDHLFEQPADLDELEARFRVYFDELRGDAPGGERDGPREDFMIRFTAWALQDALRRGDDRPVVVVCGGWHAKPIREGAIKLALDHEALELPVVESPPAVDDVGRPIRHGSHLVPYAYRRLDAFAGYDAGMPSPEYHAWVWESGHERAAELAVEAVSKRIRAKKQPLSTADLIAARGLTESIARLRGHATVMRSDLLDGLAGALVKSGMEVPFPWARRGPIAPRTEPILIEVVQALSGDRVGKLAAGTPRPPLSADVRDELANHGLEVTPRPRTVQVSLRDANGRAKSRVLHRLNVLGLPGFLRQSGPNWATDATLDEVWSIHAPLEQEPALIEASQWGATLESAALAKLEAALLDAGGKLAALAQILGVAVFVGISGLADRIIADVARAVGHEPSFQDLGAAITRLLDLSLHGDLFEARGSAQLEAVLVAAFDRGLWLLEGITGANAPLDDGIVKGVVALRDLISRGPADVVAGRDRADGVLSRKAIDADSPPSLRGACLGAMWSLDRLGDPKVASDHAITAVRAASLPTTLGDFLAGLFATARVEVLESEPLVGVIDEVVSGFTDHETMVALPSMRLSFSYFPPRERERIARLVLKRHGGNEQLAYTMIARLTIRPEDVQRGLSLDHRATSIAARYGLGDALDDFEAKA
jgi:hypothetical protein